MQISDKLAVPVILIAGGMVFLAEKLAMPFLVPLALGIFGAFALLLGAETFISGKIQMFDRLYSRREHYLGVPARLLGLAIFLFGAGILAYTAWDWVQPGQADLFLAGLVASNRGRGILAAVFGFFSLLFGLVRLIAGSAHSKEERRVLTDLSFRIWGVLGILVGALLIGLGMWLFSL